MKDDPPLAVVIDLSRLPSHGRHLGIAIRERKSTRTLPIVFVGGAADKVARVRTEVHGCSFSQWDDLDAAIDSATKKPIPISAHRAASERSSGHRAKAGSRRNDGGAGTAGYSGTPLVKKLGIQEGMRVALLAAPNSFEATLGDLPSDVTVRTAARGSFDVVIVFCKDGKTLDARLPGAVRALASGAALWIAWPKRTSPLAKDLSGDVVRERGLTTGLVDVKVCAIDEDWSGLRFVRRKG